MLSEASSNKKLVCPYCRSTNTLLLAPPHPSCSIMLKASAVPGVFLCNTITLTVITVYANVFFTSVENGETVVVYVGSADMFYQPCVCNVRIQNKDHAACNRIYNTLFTAVQTSHTVTDEYKMLVTVKLQ